MKEIWWRRWLSYLVELHVESASSDFNPHLYVSLHRGRYQLSTANAVYSFDDLYTNFLQTFQKMNLEELSIQRVLLLGLGLGSIPLILEKKFGTSYQYTAVEIDEEIIYLANKYVLRNLKSPLESICADAYAFVHQYQEKFDLICMDIFLDDIIPNKFKSPLFLEQLASLLNPQGVLLFNHLALNKKDKALAKTYFQTVFHPKFPEGTFLDVSSNYVLINSRAVLK